MTDEGQSIPEADIIAMWNTATEKFLSAANNPDPDLRKLVGHAAIIDSLSARANSRVLEHGSLLFDEPFPQDADNDENEEESGCATDSDPDSSTTSESDCSDGGWRIEVEPVDVVESEGIPPEDEAAATALHAGSKYSGRQEAACREHWSPPLECAVSPPRSIDGVPHAPLPSKPLGPSITSCASRELHGTHSTTSFAQLFAIPARSPARLGQSVLIY